jgi:hypothetical protein
VAGMQLFLTARSLGLALMLTMRLCIVFGYSREAYERIAYFKALIAGQKVPRKYESSVKRQRDE